MSCPPKGVGLPAPSNYFKKEINFQISYGNKLEMRKTILVKNHYLISGAGNICKGLACNQ